MKNYKLPFSLVIVALALGAAITSHALNKSIKTTIIQGYINTNPLGTICVASILCSDELGPICTTGINQVYGKNASGICNIVLYRNRI